MASSFPKTASPKMAKLINTGAALCEDGQFKAGEEVLSQAIALDSTNWIAYLNRAYANLMLGNAAGMDADLNRAREIDPKNPEIHFKIGVLCRKVHVYITAIQAFSCAIELKSNYAEAWLQLADCYYRIGAYDNARNVYIEAKKKFPQNASINLELAYLLPPVLSFKEEGTLILKNFIQNLDDLMNEGFTFKEPENAVLYLPFYHAYYGVSNREILEKMASFFYKTCPEVNFTAPHVKLPRAPKKKIKVGFVSSYVLKAVLNQFLKSLIENVAANDDFEVCVLITDTAPKDPAALEMTAKMNRFIALPRSHKEAQKVIAKEKFDILIYLEIGMGMRPYFLALAKLAPIQCDLSCHPMTSGIPTIDYFFSCDTMEPPNAQENYTEKLSLFNRNLAVFHRPNIPKEIMTREQLRLPVGYHLYCSPVMLFKLHPDMDVVFAKILERDPKALILLFDSQYKTLWRSTLEKRFNNSIPPHNRSRIVFLNHAPKDMFFQILCNVDAILDTFHYSFGTTTFLTVGANLPFVTWPGKFLRGRGAAWAFERMGVTELIGNTHEEYIEIALRLANDKAFRAEMSEKIRATSDMIFEDYEVANQFAARLKELYHNHLTS